MAIHQATILRIAHRLVWVCYKAPNRTMFCKFIKDESKKAGDDDDLTAGSFIAALLGCTYKRQALDTKAADFVKVRITADGSSNLWNDVIHVFAASTPYGDIVETDDLTLGAIHEMGQAFNGLKKALLATVFNGMGPVVGTDFDGHIQKILPILTTWGDNYTLVVPPPVVRSATNIMPPPPAHPPQSMASLSLSASAVASAATQQAVLPPANFQTMVGIIPQAQLAQPASSAKAIITPPPADEPSIMMNSNGKRRAGSDDGAGGTTHRSMKEPRTLVTLTDRADKIFHRMLAADPIAAGFYNSTAYGGGGVGSGGYYGSAAIVIEEEEDQLAQAIQNSLLQSPRPSSSLSFNNPLSSGTMVRYNPILPAAPAAAADSSATSPSQSDDDKKNAAIAAAAESIAAAKAREELRLVMRQVAAVALTLICCVLSVLVLFRLFAFGVLCTIPYLGFTVSVQTIVVAIPAVDLIVYVINEIFYNDDLAWKLVIEPQISACQAVTWSLSTYYNTILAPLFSGA
jgi:hypothetical protein